MAWTKLEQFLERIEKQPDAWNYMLCGNDRCLGSIVVNNKQFVAAVRGEETYYCKEHGEKKEDDVCA